MVKVLNFFKPEVKHLQHSEGDVSAVYYRLETDPVSLTEASLVYIPVVEGGLLFENLAEFYAVIVEHNILL